MKQLSAFFLALTAFACFVLMPASMAGQAPAQIPDDLNPGVVTVDPTMLNLDSVRMAIGYPQEARDLGIQGEVIIRVRFDKQGRYERDTLIQGVHPILDDAIRAKVIFLRCTPAIIDGQPAPFYVNIPFKFKLLDNFTPRKKRRRER